MVTADILPVTVDRPNKNRRLVRFLPGLAPAVLTVNVFRQDSNLQLVKYPALVGDDVAPALR